MLSQDLARYVDLHRSMIFKFRPSIRCSGTFWLSLRRTGKSSCASAACLTGPGEHPPHLNGAIGSLRFDASRWRCRLRIRATKCRPPMPWDTELSSAELYISINRMRSPG